MVGRILAVDDDRSFLKVIKEALQAEGYEVLTASEGESAMDMVAKHEPDLILMDLRMPGMDGLQLCQLLRERFTTPIIMLTAKADDVDVVVGLELGADDYITKPCNLKEVIARIRAHLRRNTLYSLPPEENSAVLKHGKLVIDRGAHEIKAEGKVVNLRPLEFKLLTFLAERPNRVFSRQEIQEGVWESDVYVDSRTLDVHIRRLREKVERDPANPQYIITVRGFGYKFQ